MTRLEAVRKIMNEITDELVIVSTGFLSRDVFAIKDRPQNFYMCGSMGNAFPIGIGIALNSSKKVMVISGDGAALMSLNSLALSNKLKLKNLKHYIIDNGRYASTGGQPTCSEAIDFSQFFQTEVIHVDDDEPASPRIPLKPETILKRFNESI
jgi:thiamine pyrophosphate-dependent acetolactate synthase large subunit-like protein